jgi:hypothetical protein
MYPKSVHPDPLTIRRPARQQNADFNRRRDIGSGSRVWS